MSTAPVVTIFVRHSAGCKYQGDEFCKRCRCRKHFRWSQNGKQYRRTAGTRSWAEAENKKRELEDQLAGRAAGPTAEEGRRYLQECVDVFLQDRKVQGLTEKSVMQYRRELDRLTAYCERKCVYVVQGLTRELLTEYAGTWVTLYPSTTTRSVVRARLRAFLRYCYEAQWLPRIPPLPKIQVSEPETMPLTAEEYARLLAAIPGAFADKFIGKLRDGRLADDAEKREHRRQEAGALIQLMRWSGLAIRDAVTLRRDALRHDKAKGLYRIVTSRQKTGTHVSVPIPPDVAAELLALPINGNRPEYFFWRSGTTAEIVAGYWANDFIGPLFDAAKIHTEGRLRSHRLRDTFAVDLLQKGVPLEEVSKALGHTSVRTTERHYAKWVKARQDRLDALVTGTWGAAGS